MDAMHEPRLATHIIGERCVAADHACVSGDLAALRAIALQLAEGAHEPLHCALIALAEQCRCEPALVTDAWFRLRPQLLTSDGPLLP